MKRMFILFSLFLLAGLSAIGQGITIPDLSGYRKISNYPVYNPENLYDFIDGAADIYLKFGFEELNVAEYVKGRSTIKLEIYRHTDKINAFGIYSSERSSGFSFINVGSQGYRADAALNFLKGRYYVKIRTNSKAQKVLRMLEPLAIKVADALPGEASLPKTLLDFPENGKKRNQETYINEGVLGHEFLKDAFRAVYENGDQEFSIYIIDKRGSDDTGKTINNYLLKCKLDPDNSPSGKVVIDDGYNGNIFLSWKDNRIVIIQGLSREETEIADRFTSEILNKQ